MNRLSILPIFALLATLHSPLLAEVEPAPEPAPGEAPQAEAPAPPPDEVPLSPLVTRLIEDPITDEATRQQLRVFHGQWDGLDEAALPPALRAQLALLRFDLNAIAPDDADAPALTRAEAALHRGEPADALRVLEGDTTAQAAVLRAEAHEQRGALPQAIAELEPWRERARQTQIDDAAELTAVARALAMLARLQGRPAADYQLVLNLLGRARELDPLYWPAQLAEAELLVDKDNRKAGADAMIEALTLNPKAGAAWHQLGVLAIDGFDFDRAAKAAEKLREINPTHLLADLLDARSYLQQRDTERARAAVETALAQHPTHRGALALLAATEALSFNEAETQAVLARIDELSPGSPDALYLVGSTLSTARQYDWGARVLRQAIERQPNWPAPWIELGLLLMQAGDLEGAKDALTQAARLDPFNRRAANQLRLAEEILGYERIETEHFIIRFKKGVDEALARDMPDELEAIYRDITGVFQHRPANKTQIDIMPDERYFGVRITGMPEIWTIAAATGDVISLTPPREGRHQRGPYHWSNVLRHEFVHTVTLSQTDNRIPHWFTEACAVSQETTGRTYDTCQLLAWAVNEDKLFALDTINWGFIRPQTERDRPLAYAQADWMLEYTAQRFGHRAIVQMLELFRTGMPDTEAIPRVTGQSAEEFMSGFRAWAVEQVASWGLDKRPMSEKLQAVLNGSASAASFTPADWATLESENPNHPDALRLLAERALQSGDAAAAERATLRYAEARPVDPWADRVLAQLAAARGDMEAALPYLERLDAQDNSASTWSVQLADAHRAAGRLDEAAAAMQRAILREPYNATFRGTAAAIHLQRGDLESALHHIRAMAILEPERPEHHVRLAAIYTRLNRPADARAAAEAARELDPNAPVEKFLR